MGNVSLCNKPQVEDVRDGTETEEQKLFLELEAKMIEHTGVLKKAFKVSSVPVDSSGNTVRTYEVGEGPITIVFLHGYGAASLIYWKIIKPLSEKYRLIFVDTLGMGGSSRPDFEIKDPEEAVKYLIAWFEAWRIQMSDLTGFVLAGHSFGGYIAGHYACKYP